MASPTSARRKLKTPTSVLCLCSLALLTLLDTALSGSVVRELPGFSCALPFTLETGYTTVGDVEFFYWFVHSESQPSIDPILLWMNGGPGCSSMNGLIYQIGPLKFNTSDYVGGLPSLIYDPNGWSKTANLLFVDVPVGAGFSYATTQAGYYTTDTQTAEQVHYFVRNWLADHHKFQLNRVLIGSDSYAGIYTPMIATNIIAGNEAGLLPRINIEGYVLSCPHTFTDLETNSKVSVAHRLTLISDALYESLKNSCKGNYVESTSPNCTVALVEYEEMIELINPINVIEPKCAFLSPESNEALRILSSNLEKHGRALQGFARDYILSFPGPTDLWCRNFEYILAFFWLNDPHVKDAIHVREGTVGHVYRCNDTLEGYTVDTNSVVSYHKNLTSKGLQILAFNGDHDMIIPHNAVESWIKYLNLTIDVDWRPWFVDGQVAGYTRKYTDNGYRLTYATLKGSGHSPPEFKRKECFNLFHRWVHYYPV